MSEKGPHFTPYEELDSEDGSEIRNEGQAERIVTTVISQMQEQRNLNGFEDVATNREAWSLFSLEYDNKLKNEMEGRPESQVEHVVFAAYRVQRARAIEQYLYQCQFKGVDLGKRSAFFEELRLTAATEAEQSVVTALCRAGDNVEIRRRIAAMFASIGGVDWGKEISNGYDDLVNKRIVEGPEQKKMINILAGVTGHSAAIEITQKMLDCCTYSPAVDLDGHHSIDFGTHSKADGFLPIDTVIQVKTNVRLDSNTGMVITPVSLDPDERLDFVSQDRDFEGITIEDKVAYKRELTLAKLQYGAAWLQRQNYRDVDNEHLLALLLELKPSKFGKEMDNSEDADGCFDIHTGICNTALRDEAEFQAEAVKQELERLRQGTRRIYSRRLKSSNRMAGVA